MSPEPAFSNRGVVGLRRVANLRADVLAGLTVTALPQSMAYALIAAVDARYGLYTAMVFGALATAYSAARDISSTAPPARYRCWFSVHSRSSIRNPPGSISRPCSCSR